MGATSHFDCLADAINEKRPIVLFLGQDAWRMGERLDPVIVSALKRSGRCADTIGWNSLLSSEPLPDNFYEWLASQFMQQVEAEWLEPIVGLPLSSVFTSSIDPSLPRSFRQFERDIESVLSTSYNPSAPRHRRNLHITYLYGRAGEIAIDEAPPKSRQALLKRTSLHAAPLLSRLIETTTSLGVLLIDGLVLGRDWLSAEALYGVLSAFNPGQVFWFGWNPALVSGDITLIEELAGPNGPVTFVSERLSSALRALILEGRIPALQPYSFALDNTITIGDSILQVEPSIRLKTSTAASIVDDSWLAPLPEFGDDTSFEEFRRFHGHVEDARRLIEGIQRGFAIKRNFESELYEKVSDALKDAGRQREPIVIHGQSGTGKSLALARLACDVRRQEQYPVLIASRASRVPAVDEIDDFCLCAEDIGALGTLIICDANAPIARYQELLRGFQSRGRRVVIVGSSYRVSEVATTNQHRSLFEVPSDLNVEERGKLDELLSKYAGLRFVSKESQFLLATLYRILPVVRPRLAAGLGREASVVEDVIRSRGSEIRHSQPEPKNALFQALIDVGLVPPMTQLENCLYEFMGIMCDSASKVIDYVMVPGKLECPVPINLLMRAVKGSENFVDIASLLSEIDLFRWSSNDEGDVFIHPRLTIEAELISARRLGSSQAEINILLELFQAANPTAYGSCERRFILDLVHRLGPDGPFGALYASFYVDIARALTEMRERLGFSDPSLMLQEATLRRRALRDAANISGSDSAELLEEARQVIELALEEFGTQSRPGLQRMCANLKVERAAIYGFRAIEQLKSNAAENEVWQFYQAARLSAKSAVFAADTYHAIDVSLWGPAELLKGRKWDKDHHAELMADIMDGLERVDFNQLTPVQRENFEERRVKVAQVLEDKSLESEALTALDRMGSHASVFLRAHSLGGSLWGSGKASDEDLERAGHVATFMREHETSINEDSRCLRYLLRAQWILATGNYFFGVERAPLPSENKAQRELLALLEKFSNVDGYIEDPRIQYLKAVLMWMLKREPAAREVWRELSQETAFNDPRRVVRHHVWTDHNGRPQLFHGRVVNDSVGPGRARVNVEEINQNVDIFQREFSGVDFNRGAEIRGGFYIAFNFIGPIAEPVGRRGARL